MHNYGSTKWKARVNWQLEIDDERPWRGRDSSAPIYYHLLAACKCVHPTDAKTNKSTKTVFRCSRGFHCRVRLDSDDTEMFKMSLNVPPIDGRSPYQLGSQQNFDLSRLTRQANREQIIDQNNTSVMHPFSGRLNQSI